MTDLRSPIEGPATDTLGYWREMAERQLAKLDGLNDEEQYLAFIKVDPRVVIGFVDVVVAARNIVWKRENDGTIRVVEGLDRLEQAIKELRV